VAYFEAEAIGVIIHEKCGSTRDGFEQNPCRRTKGHRGKHRGRLGAPWAQTAAERRAALSPAYIPPHRRAGNDTTTYTGRRYRRPSANSVEG
jgi:hypothetical protein